MDISELRIYKIASKLRNEVHKEMAKIPNNWIIDDIRQIKRSSSSVPSNITEGFSGRFYPKKFIHYLSIAMGSSDETQNHAAALYQCGYISQEIGSYFEKEYKDLSIRILNYKNYQREKNGL